MHILAHFCGLYLKCQLVFKPFAVLLWSAPLGYFPEQFKTWAVVHTVPCAVLIMVSFMCRPVQGLLTTSHTDLKNTIFQFSFLILKHRVEVEWHS